MPRRVLLDYRCLACNKTTANQAKTTPSINVVPSRAIRSARLGAKTAARKKVRPNSGARFGPKGTRLVPG